MVSQTPLFLTFALILSLFPVTLSVKLLPQLNVDSFLDAFSKCIFHITTYEFRWGPPVNGVFSKHFAQDLTPFNTPIIMSKPTINLGEIDKNLAPFGIFRKTSYLNYTNIDFHFRPKLHKKPCVVQSHILPELSTLPPYFELDLLFVSDPSIIVPKLGNVLQNGKDLRINVFKTEVYQLLFTPQLEKIQEIWATKYIKNLAFSSLIGFANEFNRLCIRYSPANMEFQEFYVRYHSGKCATYIVEFPTGY